MCVQKQRLTIWKIFCNGFQPFPPADLFLKILAWGPLGHLLFVNSRVKRNHFGISSGDTGGPRGSHWSMSSAFTNLL